MTIKTDVLERHRCALQATLDANRSQDVRNRLGQFSTPTQLASDMLAFGLDLLPGSDGIRFFDPAIGTGSFYSALLATHRHRPVIWARGLEIDPYYGMPARHLWKDGPLQVTLGDFTRQVAPRDDAQRANLLICNPPYVRHHHLNDGEKTRLREIARAVAHIDLSGLAGLYCYFMALAHNWISEDGIAGWLIPSEFMDVNYGKALKAYLLREVTLLQIHRFDPSDTQFDDALVSSAVVWFRKAKPPPGHRVTFSYGGALQKPTLIRNVGVHDLERTEKWTRFPKQVTAAEYDGYRLGDFFAIKRGLATGDNSFFILDEIRARSLNLPRQFLRPILPGARHVKVNEINADDTGVPLLDKRLFLLDCDLPEDMVKRDYPTVWAYLQTGADHVASRYLCRSRRYWYAQERRPAAPIVCTYMGRSGHGRQPFRFLLNHSQATATNVYLCLYPQPLLVDQLRNEPGALRTVWQALNVMDKETLISNGRVYGGGLHKLEPRELANVPAHELATIVGLSKKSTARQLTLDEMLIT